MNKKRIALTLFMAFLGEIANKLVPLINLHLIANRLGVQAFGMAQYALWLLEWGIVFTTFGFPQVAPVLLQNTSSTQEERRVNGSIVVARTILAALAVLVLVACVRINPRLEPYQVAVFSSLFIILASAIESSWILVAKQKLAALSAISIFAKFISVVAIIALIHSPDDAVTFVVVTNLVNAIIAGSSFVVALRIVGISKPSLQEVRQALVAASPYALAIVLFLILERFDLFIIENYFGPTATGLYSAASKLVSSVTPIMATISGVFYSEMLANRDLASIEKLIKASLFWIVSVISPVAFLLFRFDAQILGLVFDDGFRAASSILSNLSFSLFFQAAIFVFGFQLLAMRRQWLPLVLAFFLSTIVGISLGCFYISSQNMSGVAIAAVVAKLIASVLVTAAAVRSLNISFNSIVSGLARPLLPILFTILLESLAEWLGLMEMTATSLLIFTGVTYTTVFTAFNLTEVRWILNRLAKLLSPKGSSHLT